MNPPSTPADLPDPSLQAFTKLWAKLILTHTTDNTPEQSFSRPFILEDVTWAKNRVKTLYLGGAEGLDKVNYHDFMRIPNGDLLTLYNTCISSCNSLHLWLTTILVVIQEEELLSHRPKRVQGCWSRILHAESPDTPHW